ncbi:MAG: hypothetical protein HC897_19885 [Thermoanaerobaculia bacterium]|nr:hypothetical protein [Thermoanaerobaculia bacterium]
MRPETLARLFEPIEKLRAARGTRRPQELLPALQAAMWETLAVEKDTASLARGRTFIAEERERLEQDLRLAEPFDLVLAAEHRNLLEVAEVIVEAADLRRESRGSHVRSDFPERDDAGWLTNLFAWRENGALRLERRWINAEHGWVDQPGDVRIKPWG